jgi:hypothetical protein
MSYPLKARVVRGRLTLDEPIELPDGTVVHLVLADDGDALDEEERARLHEALDCSAREVAEGKAIPATDVLATIRKSPRR